MIVQVKCGFFTTSMAALMSVILPTTHTDIPENVDSADLQMDDISVSFDSKQNIHYF